MSHTPCGPWVGTPGPASTRSPGTSPNATRPLVVGVGHSGLWHVFGVSRLVFFKIIPWPLLGLPRRSPYVGG